MRMRLYNFLVNKHSGIRQTYHRLHDNADGLGRVKSYAALLSMNAQYYFLGKKDFDMPADVSIYEEKKLTSLSESAAHIKKTELSANRIIEKLSLYDVISFDVFDTLLLRPFSEPTDVFFFLGEKLGVMDFKRIRIQQEYLARKEHERKHGDNEVTFKEIWQQIEKEVGISANEGMKAELEAEECFCFANPFFTEVVNALKERGKKLIAVSDMYLPSDFVRKLLEKNGFTGIDKIFMSCEYGKSKSEGDLYGKVRESVADLLPLPNSNIIHVGDNEHSDVKKAREAGFAAIMYSNVNAVGKATRTYDLSPIIGGAYRGVVNARLFNGLKKYTPEYEYGYIYGGLLVIGYCSFIHNYCKTHAVEKILFLSRDGDIVKKVYDALYPDDSTQYVYISRAVATRLMRNHNRYDFLRRFVDYKVNRKFKISEILHAMNLDEITAVLRREERQYDFTTDSFLTSGNMSEFKSFLISHFSLIDKVYQEEDQAAADYYTTVLSGVKKAVAADIGWAGSGAVSLSILSEKNWGLDTEVIGLVAGTNTLHNTEPDAAEEFLQSGRLVPYVFSQSLNRDIMKKHDPNKGYNIFWELLFSSPTRQFTGFKGVAASDSMMRTEKEGKTYHVKSVNVENKTIELLFGESDANIKGIKRIRKGILDFVSDYCSHFKDYPHMMDISGRDAAAPLLLAAGNNERFLKSIANRFDFKIDVG